MAIKILTKEVRVEFYHQDKFDKNKIDKIRNYQWGNKINKPSGGLWTTPEGSKNNWKDFCKDWRDPGDKSSLTLKKGSKVFVLDEEVDFKDLPTIVENDIFLGTNNKVVNWERLIEIGVQAFWLTDKASLKFHLNSPEGYLDFNAWDVETILILDPMCINDEVNANSI